MLSQVQPVRVCATGPCEREFRGAGALCVVCIKHAVSPRLWAAYLERGCMEMYGKRTPAEVRTAVVEAAARVEAAKRRPRKATKPAANHPWFRKKPGARPAEEVPVEAAVPVIPRAVAALDEGVIDLAPQCPCGRGACLRAPRGGWCGMCGKCRAAKSVATRGRNVTAPVKPINGAAAPALGLVSGVEELQVSAPPTQRSIVFDFNGAVDAVRAALRGYSLTGPGLNLKEFRFELAMNARGEVDVVSTEFIDAADAVLARIAA